ncbi:hypothetical protein EON66_01550 [archaeon]|nr:MAG: hypothetical protein EON66_01550 [archaeon]
MQLFDTPLSAKAAVCAKQTRSVRLFQNKEFFVISSAGGRCAVRAVDASKDTEYVPRARATSRLPARPPAQMTTTTMRLWCACACVCVCGTCPYDVQANGGCCRQEVSLQLPLPSSEGVRHGDGGVPRQRAGHVPHSCPPGTRRTLQLFTTRRCRPPVLTCELPLSPPACVHTHARARSCAYACVRVAAARTYDGRRRRLRVHVGLDEARPKHDVERAVHHTNGWRYIVRRFSVSRVLWRRLLRARTVRHRLCARAAPFEFTQGWFHVRCPRHCRRQPVVAARWNPTGTLIAYATAYDWSKGAEHFVPSTPSHIYVRQNTMEHMVKKR